MAAQNAQKNCVDMNFDFEFRIIVRHSYGQWASPSAWFCNLAGAWNYGGAGQRRQNIVAGATTTRTPPFNSNRAPELQMDSQLSSPHRRPLRQLGIIGQLRMQNWSRRSH